MTTACYFGRTMGVRLLVVAILFLTSVGAAQEIRQPPTLRDAAKQHMKDGMAFFQAEQFGPAIVEFRAAWELSNERDLLHNLSWTCEKAGRIVEAKDYASRFLAQSKGTADEGMAERRVKFLAGRYPEAASPMPPPTTAAPTPPMPPPATATAAPTPPIPDRRRVAIGLVAGGTVALALSIGLAGGAIADGAEAGRPDTYYDRYLLLSGRAPALAVASGVFGATGIGLLVPGVLFLRGK